MTSSLRGEGRAIAIAAANPSFGGITVDVRWTRMRSLSRWLVQPPDLPPLMVQCVKVALACGLAWWLGPFLHLSHPFNAVLAVIILMQGNAYGSLVNSLQFLLGVAAGLILGIGAQTLFGMSPLVLAGIMLICLLLGGWIKVSSQGFNNQIAISALLVLASGSADNIGRLWETVLGGAVGVAVAALLWPPNPVGKLRQEFRGLRARLRSDVLRSIELAGRGADAGGTDESRRSVREHSERADAAVTEISAAEEALRWNPWHGGRMHDLSRLEDRLRLISYLYRTVRALARQAAETPPPGPRDRSAWEAARPDLRAAGTSLVEAIDRRLTAQDARDAIGRSRESVSRFARMVPREHHAMALAAVIDDALRDVEEWRPDNRVDPDRQLVARILRRLGRRREAGHAVVVEGHIEFEEELNQARLRDLTCALTRDRREPGLHDIVQAAGVTDEVDRGVRDIPLARIKGSERGVDFDVSFLPRSRQVRMEWVEVYVDMEEGRPVPPIDVYQLGEAYYVRHGHHRVSVARRLGRDNVAAHVVEVVTRAPIGSEVGAHELLHAAEYATFLERTELDKVRPEARLACSQLGRYDLITDHILGHCYFLGMERGRQVPVPEAAASWYDSVYRPLLEVARAHAIPERLAGWTDTDIYLALTRLWLDLEGEGRPAGPEHAAKALLADPERVPAPLSRTPRWQRPWQLVRRFARCPGV